MLHRLIHFALGQRFLFIILTLVLIGAGVKAYPIDSPVASDG